MARSLFQRDIYKLLVYVKFATHISPRARWVVFPLGRRGTRGRHGRRFIFKLSLAVACQPECAKCS